MIAATKKDRSLVVSILAASFHDNQSVNFIVKQDTKRLKRIERLMEYSFECCLQFGNVFLSDDRKGCALVLLPETRHPSLKSWRLDAWLAISCIGLANLRRTMAREAAIKRLHPAGSRYYYLWFLAVEPSFQNQGRGTILLNQLMDRARSLSRPVYLETSTLKNIPWYGKFGFSVYHRLDLNYPLYFMRTDCRDS